MNEILDWSLRQAREMQSEQRRMDRERFCPPTDAEVKQALADRGVTVEIESAKQPNEKGCSDVDLGH